MATNQKFVDFIIDQIDIPGQVTYRKMFGEYALYLGTKVIALICDNKLYIKPTDAGRAYMVEVIEAPPYPGAKPSFLISDKLDDRTWLRNLVNITAEALPEPKEKKKKKP